MPFADGLSYRIMHGFKETWEADKNPFNKTMGAVAWRGPTGFLIDAYMDYESRPGPMIDRLGNFWWVKRPRNTPLALNIPIKTEGKTQISNSPR